MRSVTRRQLLAAAAISPFAAVVSAAAAQEGSNVSSVGEVPTTGGPRPGPLGIAPSPAEVVGVLPVAIAIEKAEVDAQVEQQEVIKGVMQNPSGPWVVSWYKVTAKLGERGNAVMAGHLDYWDVGPAVFYHLGTLVEGDEIVVTGEDGNDYRYETSWSQLFETANAPMDVIVGDTEEESLTLITCGGPFDPETGQYLERLVVRAVRMQ